MRKWLLFSAGVSVAIMVWSIGFFWTNGQGSSTVPRWEYSTITAKVRDTDFRAKLNAQGDVGWELVTFVDIGEFQTYIFKRPLK